MPTLQGRLYSPDVDAGALQTADIKLIEGLDMAEKSEPSILCALCGLWRPAVFPCDPIVRGFISIRD